MLKTLSTKSAKPKKRGVGIGSDNRAEQDISEIDGSGIDNIEVDGNEIRDNEVEKKSQKTSKSKNLFKSKKTIGLDFFTLRTRLAFIKLRQAFVKAPIFHHFNLEHHIRIETDTSGYAISIVLSQLTSDDLGR